MEGHLFQFNTDFFWDVLVRIIFSCVLGGIIGFEREHSRNKPAGIRTHMLVSMGACLVMLIAHFATYAYQGQANIDPTRIAGQVVSGIGFLGAGSIIRHGISVKGLTTAASIWIVACVGLACGIGFYYGAALVTFLVWAVLWYLKYIEDKISSRSKTKLLDIEGSVDSQILIPLSKLLNENKLSIKSLDIYEMPNSRKQRIIIQLLNYNKNMDIALLTSSIKEIEGILKVSL